MFFLFRLPPLLFCCCLLFFQAEAQQPAYLHYTIDEGLPSNEVYATYEDSLGYIWFATDHGISRFDGYSFKNYSTSDGLVHNTIFSFHEDARGRLWMRTFNSALCYLENDSIKPYKHNKKLQAFLGRNFVQCFAFDKAGNLWFVSIQKNLGLYRQDARSGEIERIKLARGFNAFIRELDSGEFIAGVDRDNGYVPTNKNDDTLFWADHTWLFRVQESHSVDQRTLIRSVRMKNGFAFTFDDYLVMIENGKITFNETLPEVINDCYMEPNGQLWLACMSGFEKFNPAKPFQLSLLNDFMCIGMLRDRVGNYWFTTIDAGVFLIRNLDLNTLNHLNNQSFDELLSLGVYNSSLFALDNKGSVFRFGISAQGIDTLASERWPKKSPGSNMIFCAPECNRFIMHHKIYTSDNADITWNSARLINDNVSNGSARGYAITHDSLLFAANSSWYISDLSGKTFYSSREHGFSSFCTAIAVAPDYKIWIGTSDGLFVFSNNTTEPFEPGNPLFRQRITDIAFGKNGEMFVSTRGGGLIVLDGNERYNLRMSDGLSSDQCGNICLDDSVLWLCSNNGLNRISIHRAAKKLTFLIERINTQHGLPSMMVNDALRVGNFLFLATGKGLAWFDVNVFHFNRTPPSVYISTFLTNNHQTNPATEKLSWVDRNISIGFIALLFRSPGDVNYRYRLEGYESNWNYTKERMARYFNLPAGQYKFVVSAMNENGTWSTQPATVNFYIPAHFSETVWFRTLIILLLVGAAGGIVFYYQKQQRNKAKAVLALAQAELKALRAQMKPHFIFNSLNSIQNFIIKNEGDSAHIYLTSFAQLMRRVLDHSRFSVITLQEELDTIGLYLELEKLRFGESFVFTIEVQPELQPSSLLIPPLFIQPFVENAIWHGLQMQKNNPQLHLHFFIEKNKLVCVIEDNGVGRKHSLQVQRTKGHSSTGMKNVEERIALLNSASREKISVEIIDLEDGEGRALGTRVILHFPLSRKEEN